MAETPAQLSELTAQYSTQVAADLERNLKEQARIGGEVEALQAQLAALQQDHAVLVKVQQALGDSSAAPVSEAVAASPAPSGKTAGTRNAGQQGRTKKSETPARKRTDKKETTKAPATPSAPPTLVSLVREHLAGQDEPRSAAEVATALQQQYPERGVKVTVVRTTLENLVAKNHAQRTKQGTSVFYTAPTTAEPTTRDEPAESQSA